MLVERMEKLYFASTNETKIREAEKLTGIPILSIGLDIPEIQISTSKT